MFSQILLASRRFLHEGVNHFNPKFLVSNRISVKYSEKILSAKDKINFPFYTNFEPDNSGFLYFYPDSVEEYNQFCNNLNFHKISFLKDFVDLREDILIDDSLLSKQFLDEYDYMQLPNVDWKCYFNIPKEEIQKYFFENNPLNATFYKKYHKYHKNRIQKLSPNILRVYHSDLLTEVKIRRAFKDYNINRITSPATRNGFWLIYAGDKNSYMALLSNKFSLENEDFIIEPHYQTSNTYPICPKSPNIIEIYSRAEELNNPEDLKAGLNINCEILTKNINSGILHTVFLPESSSSENIAYMNGLPINGTFDYIMNFGERISINTINSPFVYLNFQKEHKNDILEKLKDFNFEISENETKAKVEPRDMVEVYALKSKFKGSPHIMCTERITDINVGNTFYISKNEIFDFKTLIEAIDDQAVSGKSLETDSGYILSFSEFQFPQTFFQKEFIKKNLKYIHSATVKFLSPTKKRALMPFVFQVLSKCDDISNIKFPFNHKIIKNEYNGKQILVGFWDYQKYIFKPMTIDKHRFSFCPVYKSITEDKTFISGEIDVIKTFKDKLSSNNINSYYEGDESRLYLQFKNIDQYRQFLILFSKFIFYCDIEISFGKDILQL